MKKFNSFAMAFIAMAVCVSLSACNDDDSNEIPTPNVQKRLFSVINNYSSYGINYDNNGKISSVTSSNGSKTYSYSDSKIIVKYDSGTTTTYELSNGLIKKFIDHNDYVCTFTYSGENMVKYVKESKDDYYIDTVTFIWNDGVISSSKDTSEDEDEYYYRIFKYEYDTEHYDFGKVSAFIQSDSFLFDDLDEYLLIQGYFGNLPKYLLQSVHTTYGDDEGEEDDGTDRFYYKFDADGYPISDSWNELTYTWENVN